MMDDESYESSKIQFYATVVRDFLLEIEEYEESAKSLGVKSIFYNCDDKE